VTIKESKVIQLIKKGWCQRQWASDHLGRSVDFNSPGACAWCLFGAVMAVKLSTISQIKIEALTGEDVLGWNDEKKRTKRQVLAMLRKAFA